MDEHTRKKVAGGSGLSRRVANLSSRSSLEVGRGIQCCSRRGCGARHDSMDGAQPGGSVGIKSSKSARLSTSSKRKMPTPSSGAKGHEKAPPERRSRATLEGGSGGGGGGGGGGGLRKKKSELDSGARREKLTKLDVDSTRVDVPESSTMRVSKSTSTSRSCRSNNRRSMASGDQGVTSAPLQRSVLPRHSGQAAKSSLPQRYGLRNLSCSSISDVIRSGCADADRKKLMESSRRRCSAAGKGSTPRGKSVAGPPDFSSDGLPSSSVLERPPPRAPSRARNQLFTGTARPANGDGRMRLSRFSGDSETLLLPLPPPPPPPPPPSRGRFSLSEAAFVGSPPSGPLHMASTRQRGLGGGSRPASAALRDRNSRFSDRRLVDDVAEVLLALERLEQEEELTHERLTALHSTLVRGGIGFPDQHRDWRLDIDDMTYEELLALEEKMGTVSTALSEKQLLECLESSLFRPSSGLGAPRAYDSDDTKCSICQEEYGLGDEMGKLHCGHRYHMGCIHQWLRQKNWCPVCKSSASPSSKGRD